MPEVGDNKQVIEMTAYCGLVCGDCLRYRNELTKHAKSLFIELAKRKFADYAAIKMKFDNAFEDYPIFIAVLKKIVELECHQSCRKGGGCATIDCQILKCCLEKQYEGCWQCEQLRDCNNFDFLKPFHGETPKSNCIDLQNHGFDNFAARKRPFYIWDQKAKNR